MKDFNTYLYGTLANSIRTGYSAAVKEYQYPVNIPKRKSPVVEGLIGLNVKDALISLWGENHPLANSLATALVDSALKQPKEYSNEKSPQAFMNYARDKKLAFIGHFPYAEKIRDKGLDVSIVEIDPAPGDIHWNNSHEVLGGCDIVFITGFAFVNRTLEEIIRRTPDSIRVFMGATVPFAEVFFDLGIHALCSVLIRDAHALNEHYRHGGRAIKNLSDEIVQSVISVRSDKRFILE